MSAPRHLKVTRNLGSPNVANEWQVKIGNIIVGLIIRAKDGFNFAPNDRLPQHKGDHTRTMKEMKECLVESIDKQTYERILDTAYKAGYKG